MQQQDSPFMALPLDLRLTIYDTVLSDLIGDRLGAAYQLPADMPQNDITDFVRLTLVCRTVHHELKDHFEKTYIDKVMLFFDDPFELARVNRLRCLLGPPYESLRFSLITHSTAVLGALRNQLTHEKTVNAELPDARRQGPEFLDECLSLERTLHEKIVGPIAPWNRQPQPPSHSPANDFDEFGLGRWWCTLCPNVRVWRTSPRTHGVGPRIDYRTLRDGCQSRFESVMQKWQIGGGHDAQHHVTIYSAIPARLSDLDGVDIEVHEKRLRALSPSLTQRELREARNRTFEAVRTERFQERPEMQQLVESLNCECCTKCRHANRFFMEAHGCQLGMKGPHEGRQCGRDGKRCTHVPRPSPMQAPFAMQAPFVMMQAQTAAGATITF